MSNNESIYIEENTEKSTENFGDLLMEHEKETSDEKRKIINSIKELAQNSTNWKEAKIKLDALLEEYKNIPYYDQKENNMLNEELKEAKDCFFKARQEFYDKSKEHFKENENKKLELINLLKDLSYSNGLKETDELLKKYSEQFYEIGFAGKDINDKLFHEFKEIKSNLYSMRKETVKNLQKDFAVKAERKKEIIKKLKELVNNENWKKATEEFTALCNEFKSIGFSGKEGNDEISEGYAKAKNEFFSKRQEYFDELKAGNRANLEARRAIIEELKGLYENENWKEAAEKVKALSEKFFHIGFCGKEENENIINEFKEARDEFYALRQDYFDKINSARAHKQEEFLQGLIDKKEEFIKKLKTFIKNDEERLNDFTDRLFNGRPTSIERIENMQNIVEDIKSRLESNKAKIKQVQSEIFDLKKQIDNLK